MLVTRTDRPRVTIKGKRSFRATFSQIYVGHREFESVTMAQLVRSRIWHAASAPGSQAMMSQMKRSMLLVALGVCLPLL